MARRTKYLLILIALLPLAIATYWQVDYEIAISKARENCAYLQSKKRISHTPVVIYKVKSLFRMADCKTDLLICKTAFSTCPDIQTSGYYLEYMVYVYLSTHEKDSLVNIYNVLKHPTPRLL